MHGARSVTHRLALDGEDVAALLSTRSLQTVVVGMHQPEVRMGSTTRDFDWLQRVLRNRIAGAGGPVRLTSNELAYKLESLDVFNVRHEDALLRGSEASSGSETMAPAAAAAVAVAELN